MPRHPFSGARPRLATQTPDDDAWINDVQTDDTQTDGTQTDGTRARVAKVLVVEDDSLIRALIAETLRDAGFTVVDVSSGDEAWDYLSTTDLLDITADESGFIQDMPATDPADRSSVDVLFTDLKMPGRLQGAELVARARERFTEMAVIIASGDLSDAPSQSFDHFLQKPFHLDAAVTLVERVTRKAPN